MSLFDTQNLCEIASEEYPGERIALPVGRIIDRYKVRKHSDLVFGCRHTCSTPGSRCSMGGSWRCQ